MTCGLHKSVYTARSLQIPRTIAGYGYPRGALGATTRKLLLKWMHLGPARIPESSLPRFCAPRTSPQGVELFHSFVHMAHIGSAPLLTLCSEVLARAHITNNNLTRIRGKRQTRARHRCPFSRCFEHVTRQHRLFDRWANVSRAQMRA